MNRTAAIVSILGCLIACISPAVHAQAATPNPATLADALKIAAPPVPGAVVIAVNGDWAKPPDGAQPLGDHPDVPTISPASELGNLSGQISTS